MTVRNRGRGEQRRWYYDFVIRGTRYRSSIPEARTKADAVEAENAERRKVFDNTYGTPKLGSRLFSEFVEDVYMPWAKTNKRTWANDEGHAAILKEAFKGKALREVSPLIIEKLKRELSLQTTKRGTTRAPASVNLVMATGSRIFTLACDTDQASTNPFRKVKKLSVDNHQLRYLGWEEERRLIDVLINPPVKVTVINGRSKRHSISAGIPIHLSATAQTCVAAAGTAVQSGAPASTHHALQEVSQLGSGNAVSRPSGRSVADQVARVSLKTAQRQHLRDAIPIAVGTGLRRREQTTLRVRQCDFARNLVVVVHSKSNRMREVPMNDDVRAILLRLCKGKRADDYLFVNPITKRPYLDFKKGFAAACSEAGIHGLSWKALRHTFGTRLGEAGHNAFDIADLMGHSDVRTSQRYVHATDRRKHEAVQSTMLSRRARA